MAQKKNTKANNSAKAAKPSKKVAARTAVKSAKKDVTSKKAVAEKKKTASATAKTTKKPKPDVKAAAKNKAVTAPRKAVSKKPVKQVNTSKSARTKDTLSPREERMQNVKMTLIKQKEALLNEAEASLNELPGQTIFPDLGDQASAETDRSFMLRLRGREQRLLKKIDEAIERIDSGTFGICEDCGNEIDIKRLEARPVTTMCIECKTLQEEEEKLRE